MTPSTLRHSRRRWFGRLLAAGALLLAGCGQKGPLYLPDDAPAQGRDARKDAAARRRARAG